MEDVQDSLAPINLASLRFSKTIIGAGPVLRLKAASNRRKTPTPAIPMAGASGLNLPGGDAGTSSGINVSEERLLSIKRLTAFKLESLQETVSALAACVEKLSIGQVSRTKKYGALRSREFKFPPQRFTTPDRTKRLVNSTNRTLLTALTRVT